MSRIASRKPKKFSFLILFVLVLAILGVVAMSMDIAPKQQIVEQELDASTFLNNSQ